MLTVSKTSMRAWYENHIDEELVSTTWKTLHSFLVKKVWVSSAAALPRTASDPPSRDDPADGKKIMVSAEFVDRQVNKVIQRREQWLQVTIHKWIRSWVTAKRMLS